MSNQLNPTEEPPKGLRGGAWANYGTNWCRPSHRIEIEAVYIKASVGFRTVINARQLKGT